MPYSHVRGRLCGNGFVGSYSRAQDAPQAVAAPAPSDTTTQAPYLAASTQPTSTQPSPYQFYNGYWWYHMPDGRWMYYVNGQWVNAGAPAPAQAPAPVYAYPAYGADPYYYPYGYGYGYPGPYVGGLYIGGGWGGGWHGGWGGGWHR